MKTIDKHIIRDILDEMHIASSFDEDGDLMIVQQADENFVYDVAIYILVNDNRLSFLSAAQGAQGYVVGCVGFPFYCVAVGKTQGVFIMVYFLRTVAHIASATHTSGAVFRAYVLFDEFCVDGFGGF